MRVLRTPDDRFTDLPGFGYEPRAVEVDGLRIAYVDEGPPEADPVLCLHGEPTWSFLYRHVIAVLVDAGYRVVAPDLVGFGRSDKPAEVAYHTYARHVGWMAGFLAATRLQRVTLLCQDWGGLIGLRLAAEQPDRFARIIAANTGLPTGDQQLPAAWHAFRDHVRTVPELPISGFVQGGTATTLPDGVLAAYDAPFPDESYKAGPRALPGLVPATPDDPAAAPNRRAWAVLAELDIPVHTAFSDGDPITAGAERPIQERWRGAQGRQHPVVTGAGHFLQEDAGPELGRIVAELLEAG